jgi:sugar diacid utilization regulator
MESPKEQLLERLESQVGLELEQIARAITGTDDLGPKRDDRDLRQELRDLGRLHLQTFFCFVRQGSLDISALDFVRDRSVQRAHEMVPLASTLHAYFIGVRAFADAIVRAAGTDGALREEALRLLVRVADYSALAVTLMVEAYSETVQGERADREADRRDLLEELLTRGPGERGSLARRAAALGLEAGRSQVVVITRVEPSGCSDRSPLTRRWAAEALARGSGRDPSHAFIVVRSDDVVAVLDAAGDRPARTLVEHVQEHVRGRDGVNFTCGIGTPFSGLEGFHVSYEEARRALRHCSARRPIISSPGDITLFEDLAITSGEAVSRLIPARTRQALRDSDLRSTLQAYSDANLNVAAAANALLLHPNSVRYRLRRIATLTGRDPRQVTDLFELCAAARIIDEEARPPQG